MKFKRTTVDLVVFKQRAQEPNLAFETVLKDLRWRGRPDLVPFKAGEYVEFIAAMTSTAT
ncbi:MAG TPA: hypothetical protein VGX97_11815 [bacterium]|nr:hypothetical protein [bacterium]